MRQWRLYAFECRVKDAGWHTIVNAPTAGKARYQYWLMASDAWPELKLTEISVRKAGAPVSSDMLRQVNEMRGRRFQAGDTVTLRDGRRGCISGAGGCGAYFQVWIDGGSPVYVHPGDLAPEAGRNRTIASQVDLPCGNTE